MNKIINGIKISTKSGGGSLIVWTIHRKQMLDLSGFFYGSHEDALKVAERKLLQLLQTGEAE